MKTALQVLNNQPKGYLMLSREEFAKVMIKFAKLHVKAALEAAVENSKNWRDLSGGEYKKVSKDSILNAYPLTNIV